MEFTWVFWNNLISRDKHFTSFHRFKVKWYVYSSFPALYGSVSEITEFSEFFKNNDGADPGFPVGGGATPPWEGANIHILPKTAWN